MQWELASYYPAGSSVKAATTQSRHHVIGNAGTVRLLMGKKKNLQTKIREKLFKNCIFAKNLIFVTIVR